MSNITLTLDPIALREATSQAIMGILTPEMRQKMIEEAIKGVLTPPSSQYERNLPSPLQRAFDAATIEVARAIATDMVSKDERIAAKMRELVSAAVQRLTAIDTEKMTKLVVDAFVVKFNDR